jgi:hypothetical protein
MIALNPSRAIRYEMFFRLLALVFGIAFASIGEQIQGLAGSSGILPAAELLDHVAKRFGTERFHLLPSLFWIDASDRSLSGACWLGAVISLAVAAGLAQRWGFILLWLFRFSGTISFSKPGSWPRSSHRAVFGAGARAPSSSRHRSPTGFSNSYSFVSCFSRAS